MKRAKQFAWLSMMLVVVALLAVPLGGPLSATRVSADPTGPIGYSVRADDDHLYSIDLSTGAATDLGLVGLTDVEGLASVGRTLYGIGGVKDEFWNLTTPPGFKVGDTGPRLGVDAGLAYDPTSGRMYNIQRCNSYLYEIDIATGAATFIGYDSKACPDGLAIDSSGVAYAFDGLSVDALYTVDLSTGALTLVGPLGVDLTAGVGLAFDPALGTLYALTDGGEIYTIDKDTGAATFVANTLDGFESLAIFNIVTINELDADTFGIDTLEFVELYDGGSGNTALDGLVVVFYNGSVDTSYAAFDLDGFSTDANGYLLLGNSGVTPAPDIVFGDGTLQNGADAVALYTGDAADFPDGTGVTTTDVIDAIVYDTDDPDDAELLVLLNPGQPQVNEDGGGDKDNHSNQRCPNGSGGGRNTDTYLQKAPTPGRENCVPDLSSSAKMASKIEVQGGDALTYTIRIINSGQTSTAFTLTDSIPSHTTYVPGSAWASGGDITNTNAITWTGTITGRTNLTATFAVTVDATLTQPNAIVNVAMLAGDPTGLLTLQATAIANPLKVFLPVILKNVSGGAW